MRLYYLMPLLASWTFTVCALRMRKPRPPIPLLMVQPGALACIMATTSLALRLPMLAIQVSRQSFNRNAAGPYSLLAVAAASSVGSSWIILLVSGRWRAEASWIDFLGRLLGVV